MGYKDIKPSDNPKPFTKDNQPTRESKRRGKMQKKFLKDIAGQIVDGKIKEREDIRKIANELGIDLSSIDLETLADVVQLAKAITDGDTRAYNSIKDRLRGKPLQEMNVKTNAPVFNLLDASKAFPSDEEE